MASFPVHDVIGWFRSALGEASPPCIPYIGLVLQDLTFVHIGNPDTIEDRINFAKRWQQFNILVGYRRLKSGLISNGSYVKSMLTAVFRILDILVRIRIRGSVT
jgi:hypothetical protein